MICAELREGLWEQRTEDIQTPACDLDLCLDLFSPPVFSLQSPRASCLPSLQACSHCGPPWAPFHLSHLPLAQERLRPLHPPVQVSPLVPHQPGDGRKGSRGPSTLADFLFLLFSRPFSAQWSSHNHSRCCRLCPSTWPCLLPGGQPCPRLPIPPSLDGHAPASALW